MRLKLLYIDSIIMNERKRLERMDYENIPDFPLNIDKEEFRHK